MMAWLARDECGDLHFFPLKPMWVDAYYEAGGGYWHRSTSAHREKVRLRRMPNGLPPIKRGDRIKVRQVIADDKL